MCACLLQWKAIRQRQTLQEGIANKMLGALHTPYYRKRKDKRRVDPHTIPVQNQYTAVRKIFFRPTFLSPI